MRVAHYRSLSSTLEILRWGGVDLLPVQRADLPVPDNWSGTFLITKMKRVTLLCICAVTILACRHPDEPDDTCLFSTDTLPSDAASLETAQASSRIYSYQDARSNPDSILRSLCAKGIGVSKAYNDADYFCKDMKGPRFVVVLSAPDSSILKQNFLPGDEGRFACATNVVRYMHIVPINESH